MSIFNQYVHYWRFVPEKNLPKISENKLFEIRPQTSYTTKSLFKVMDMDFLKSGISEDMVEIVLLLQEFVGEYDDSNYSLPAVPHTFLSTFVLEVSSSFGKIESSRVFTAEAFIKALPGPFSVFNIHPTFL